MAWGNPTAGNTDDSAQSILQVSGVFPCLDVLYPGKFRFHCTRCTQDAEGSKFTRHKFYMFAGFTESGGERLYRMPLAVANSYVEGMARGRFGVGSHIKVLDDGRVVFAGDSLGSTDCGLQDVHDDPAYLAEKVVRNEFEIFGSGMDAYVLQSERVPPYLLLVHETAMPSQVDIMALERHYSREFIAELDAEYEKNLNASFKK